MTEWQSRLRFAQWIYFLHHAQEVTPATIEARTGMSTGWVSGVLKGEDPPNTKMPVWVNLAAIFGVDVLWLAQGTGKPGPSDEGADNIASLWNDYWVKHRAMDDERPKGSSMDAFKETAQRIEEDRESPPEPQSSEHDTPSHKKNGTRQ